MVGKKAKSATISADFKPLPMWGRFGLLLIWAGLVTVTVREIYFGEAPARASGTAIATLVSQTGTVQYRPGELAIWNRTGREHLFFEGDLVATGENSEAVVRFYDGRQLSIQELSQISLATERDPQAATYGSIVTLLRGNLAAKNTGQGSGELHVKAGSATFSMNQGGTGVTLKQKRGAKAPRVEDVVGTVDLTDGKRKAVVFEAQGRIAIAAKDPSMQKEVEESFAAVIAKVEGLEARLALEDVKTYWVQPGADGRYPGRLAAGVLPPAVEKAPKNWAPVIRLASNKKTFAGDLRFERQEISLPVDDLVRAALPSASAGHERSLRLEPGAELRTGESVPRSFSGGHPAFTFKSFGWLPDRPMSLALANFAVDAFDDPATNDPTSGFLLEEGPPPEAPAAVIHVKSRQDLLKIVPLVPKAGGFAIAPGDVDFREKAYYFVRGGEVVARLSTKKANAKAAVRLGKSFGADIVFSGRGSSYFPVPKGGDVVGRLTAASGGAKSIYVLDDSGKKLVKISASFLSERSVLDFLARSGNVFFEKVDIIWK